MGPVMDLDLGPDGGPQLIEGPGELAQTVEVRLRMIRGSAWEDVACGLWSKPGGTPNGVVMGQKPGNRNLLRFEILQELRKEARVTQVDSLTITEDQALRTVSARAYVRGTDGAKIAIAV
jgi:hypothetical protein